MKYPPAILALAAFLPPAAAAAAAVSPAARIQAVLSGASLELAQVPVPAAAPRSAPRPALLPAELWASLPAPEPRELERLARRVPGLDRSKVRQLTPEAGEQLFANALARGQAPIDLFTDPLFRGPQLYYVPHALLKDLFSRYEVKVLTLVEGRTTSGQPYKMEALLAGAGRVEAHYSLDQFRSANTFFEGEFTFSSRVVQTILGPGDIAIEGIVAHVAFLSPAIQRMVKTGPRSILVETSLGSRERVIDLIRRR